MDLFTASMIVEDELEEYTEEQALEAWEYLIRTGYAQRLGGWYARMAYHLTNMGAINVPALA